MAAADTAKLMAVLSLKDELSKGLKTAQGNLGKFESSLGRVGKGAGQVGAGLARAGTVIAGAAITGFGAAAKAAIDWEDAFAGVVKTVDETDLRAAGLTFRDLELALRKMSTEMPNSAMELAGIAEAAGALGIKATDIESFTRQVAILAATTDVSASDAATALGQLTNVLGLTGAEFDNFSAALVDLGNKGASTESAILEITKRSGLAAKTFGLTTDQTLAFASAAANLGINAEAAGTNLSKAYGKAQSAFEKGSKTLQTIMGKDSKALKKLFADDPKKAISSLLRELSKLEGAEQTSAIQKLFGKNQIITNLVRGLAESLDTNLTPSLETSSEAWAEATAAQVEFEKRNATVKSAMMRLKNGILDAAITVGEGFVPALGRASDKLSTFLKSEDNRNALKALGEDIGKAIDDVDWKDVLDGAKDFISVLKIALDYAKRIFDVINMLPTEVKAAGAGFLAINKLSGGLFGAGLGNIIGGLGGAIAKSGASKLPGIGKAFAQPVFVTNWPIGGMGGGAVGAAGKGLGALSKVFLVGEAIGLAAAVYGVQQELSKEATAHGQALETQTQKWLAQSPTREQLVNGLGGVQQGIRDLQSNPLLTLVQGEALTSLQNMETDLTKQIARIDQLKEQANRTKDDTVEATNKVKNEQTETKRETKRGLDIVKSATDRARDAALETKREAGRGLALVNASTRTGTDRLVAAVNAIPAPKIVINFSAAGVSKSVTEQNRYGPGNGSHGGGSGHAPGTGPLP